MQIVIEIDKDDFKEICMQARMVEDTGSLFGRIRKAIFHCTPLPEGHGKLKDVTSVIDELERTRTYSFQQVTDIESFKRALLNLPTIIEADKESEE